MAIASWVKYQHKNDPRIRYWVWDDGFTLGQRLIRATKNAFYEAKLEEMPPERCLPGGAFPAESIREFYERIEEPETKEDG